ncbi:hypothetical protein C2S52_021351 [Perilla frutescens var. hirtella]|nr:hypothetical protein C2S52_021351 [Perilla frutescens var. hirtella]
MESYSSTSNTDSSSSASYSYSSNSSTRFPIYHYHQQEIKSGKPRPSFHSVLHSVRKSPAKKYVITKKPIAPLPPTPPKIYKVDPVEFKDVVQKLTGAAEFQPTRLQEVAPPPLSLSPPHHRPMAYDEEEKRHKSFETACGALSPLGFSLSPSSLAWCSAMLLSPGTLASFEPSAVL